MFTDTEDNLEDYIDPYINFTTASNRNNFRNCSGTSNQNRNQYHNSRGNFNGRCKACGAFRHHAKDCNFLRKLRSCLSYLKDNRNIVHDIRGDHVQRNTYNKNHRTIRSLIVDNFIPYDNVNCDVFLDAAPDDGEDVVFDKDE